MAKIKVHLKAHRRIFKNRVDTRIAQDDRDGVGLEIIAGLTLLAFEVEARFNFLGAKLIADWDERAPAILKVKKVCKRLVIAPNFSVRPYLSVAKLKDFRDTLAHGKPEATLGERSIPSYWHCRSRGKMMVRFSISIPLRACSRLLMESGGACRR
jgi:hypothetical protein